MRIIEQRNHGDIDVQFLDSHKYIKRNITYNGFRLGEVKNPYDITVFGVGYLGEGKYKTRKNQNKMTQEYVSWTGILSRCYYNKEKYPSYYGICKVCNEWFNYQNFARWFNENKYECEERLHVDKDILHPNSKLYSPTNCMLVPQKINALFISHTTKADGLPHGITLLKSGKYKSVYNANYLGMFNTCEEAYKAYIVAKSKEIKRIVYEYRNKIPYKVYQALIEYKVK